MVQNASLLSLQVYVLLILIRHGHAIIIHYLIFQTVTECKKKKKQDKESPETSLFNFLKLFVFRLIYGFASMIGAEGVSDFMGGILVPPSVEDGDYADYIGVADDLDY